MNETLKKIKTLFAIPASMGGNPDLLTLVDKLDVDISLLEQAAGALKRLEHSLAQKWESKSTPEDKEIDAEFPTRSGEHDRFRRAHDLVAPRHGKYELIGLVNWLLARAEKAEAKRSEFEKWFRKEDFVSVYFGHTFPETARLAFHALGYLSQAYSQYETFDEALDAVDKLRQPLPMVLHCPSCGMQHIDEPKGEWKNPPHRSHQCQSCKHVWRPADVLTTGVMSVETKGRNDSPLRTRLVPDEVSGHTVLLHCQQEGCGTSFHPSKAVMERGFYRCPECGYPGQ